jgi:hypothetical protein
MGLSGFSVNVRSTQKRFINIYNADNEVSGSESAIRYVKFFSICNGGCECWDRVRERSMHLL